MKTLTMSHKAFQWWRQFRTTATIKPAEPQIVDFLSDMYAVLTDIRDEIRGMSDTMDNVETKLGELAVVADDLKTRIADLETDRYRAAEEV
ncbi:hypothetical protein [Nocardia wallacei]|uniref:hypothetical protein n=1 Tax=Nocardia wallacei TaxID=480035 RepID=UPI002454F051|nr:hypothetical protein [Nocardia wallacei]